MSVPGTAGHTDFLTHIAKNAWGYAFDVGCIDAPVQGAMAVEKLVEALHAAGRVAMRTPVDAVVLLRGGAKLDLDIFNDLTLCRTIAAMEVPVLTGIGHETDQTLADVVAHTAKKTPTAVADFLVEQLAQFEAEVGREGRALASECRAQLSEQKGMLNRFGALLGERPLAFVRRHRGDLHSDANGVVRRTRAALADQHARLAQCSAGLKLSGQLPERQCGAAGRIRGRHTARVQAPLEATRGTDSPDEGYAGLAGTGPHIEAGILDHACPKARLCGTWASWSLDNWWRPNWNPVHSLHVWRTSFRPMNRLPDMQDPKDYAAAFAELKDILSALQQDEIGVDALAEKVKAGCPFDFILRRAAEKHRK